MRSLTIIFQGWGPGGLSFTLRKTQGQNIVALAMASTP